MTTAEQLLASLTEVDRTFVIDNDLRTIKAPRAVTNLGVQSDDDVLTVYFQMPGVYCGIDLSTFNVRINYLNADEQGDYYDVDDVEIQPDGTIRFSWTVGRHAASVVGNVEFNVCLKKTDSSGNVIKEFNTTTATLPILKGLEISDQVISEYNDILEQWRAKLFGVGDTEEARIIAVSTEQQQVISEQSASILSDIELKGSETLATIPDTYTEVYRMAEEAQRTKADAIVLEAEGTVISVNDAANDPLENLKLFGRTTQAKTTGAQLFNPYAKQNNSFGTATVENNGAKITVTGTYYVSWPITLKAGVTYYIDFKASGADEYRAIRFEYPDKEITGTIPNPAKFTPTKDTVSVYLYSGLGNHGTVVYDNVMICEGSAALPWEPYTGGVAAPNPDYPIDLVGVENPTVDIYGKNLLPPRTETLEYAGLTYVTNIDGSISITGTVTSDGDSTCYIVKKEAPITLSKGSYTLSGCFGGSEKSYRILIYSVDWKLITECRDGPSTFTLNETTDVFVYIWVYRGTTPNVTLYPMICKASLDSDYYEPYRAPQSLTLNRTLHGVQTTTGSNYIAGNYTDENGQEWICDEVDLERGVLTQRLYSRVFDGVDNETISKYAERENVYGFTIKFTDVVMEKLAHVAYCTHFENIVTGISSANKECFLCGAGSSTIYVLINKERLGEYSVEAFKRWLAVNPITVLFQLATPIETPLTSEEILAYKALRTNYPNTTVLNNQGAPMVIAYNADTQIYLRDNQPKPTNEQVMAAVQAYADENGLQIPSDKHIMALISAYVSGVYPAKIGTVTLPASSWTGSGNLYSQVVSIEGVTENSQVDLTPDVEQLAIFHDKDLTFVTENDGGVVTVYAIGQQPTNDYTIQVTITEVYV